MACYRLARFFQVHPNQFLSDPVSLIVHHLKYVDRLLQELTPPDDDRP